MFDSSYVGGSDWSNQSHPAWTTSIIDLSQNIFFLVRSHRESPDARLRVLPNSWHTLRQCIPPANWESWSPICLLPWGWNSATMHLAQCNSPRGTATRGLLCITRKKSIWFTSTRWHNYLIDVLISIINSGLINVWWFSIKLTHIIHREVFSTYESIDIIAKIKSEILMKSLGFMISSFPWRFQRTMGICGKKISAHDFSWTNYTIWMFSYSINTSLRNSELIRRNLIVSAGFQ